MHNSNNLSSVERKTICRIGIIPNRKIICRIFPLLCAMIFALGQNAFAQQSEKHKVVKSELQRDEMRIRFRVSTSNINPGYMNNADSLERIVAWVDRVQQDSTIDIVGVEFCGAVSPEGSVRFNHYLSNARLKALEKYVRSRVDIPEEIIVRNDHYIAWDELKELVSKSDFANKEDIIEVLNSENRSTGEQLDSRIGDLKNMDGGVTWRKLYNTFFVDLRNAYTVLITRKSQMVEFSEPVLKHTIALEPMLPLKLHMEDMSIKLGASESVSILENRYMYVKSNLVGLGLLMANLGVEFDIGSYLSFNLPIYYSAVNYFRHTIKFRTFSLQPELRFWPTKNNDGIFIGAHAGFAYYNFAFNKEWRYQDKDGKTPTLGGGLSLGYRMPLSRDNRWKLEMAVGAGVYPLCYDVFHNEYNGQLHETRKKTYFGLDNLLLGVSYRIPLRDVEPKR